MVGQSFDYEIMENYVYVVYDNEGVLCDAIIVVEKALWALRLKFNNGNLWDTFQYTYTKAFVKTETMGEKGSKKFGHIMHVIAMENQDELRRM